MAKVSVELKQLHRTLEKLTRASSAGERGAMKGLFAGGLLVQRRSMRQTPVEYGFLRASAFTRKAIDGSNAVEVGYGAAYAIFVHENTEEKLRGKPRPSGLGSYWNPGKSKFLEDPYKESLREVIDLVKRYATAEIQQA
jgi:hypothetical protein